MEDYKVIRAIGKGSFGKVYLVKYAKDNRQYVMKVIKLKGIPPKEREACRNEVMLMKRLTHPNIVAYKDSFFANGQDNLCIVMTYCDGGDLGARLAASGGVLFKEDQIMHWFVQIALSIHYMHENKVLHRDIKTQNIFLLGNGRLVLGDLGISKVLDGTVQFANTQIGTPYYMSPELFKNKPYNHKSDVWALGCVLYELCTLHHPFDATNLQALAAKIGRGAYAPISPKYSQALHALIKSMLGLEPRQRPSMAEVLTQPYLKKHVYNFLKDIAERSALGLGAAPPREQLMLGKAPISEGTMVFRAAAGKAAGGLQSGPDAAAHAAAAGLGPHAASLQAQLVALGLKDVALKALQDALASASPPTSGAGAGPASAAAMPALKPAFSLANLNVRPSSVQGPTSVQAPAPSNNAAPVGGGQPVQSGLPVAAVPIVLGPDGRPLSPNRARKYVKEQQAALQREEERKKAVELALGRLKVERDLRSKAADDFRRRQEARLSGAGLPVPTFLSAALPGVAAAAAARAYSALASNPGSYNVNAQAGLGGGKAPLSVAQQQIGLPPRPSAVIGIGPTVVPIGALAMLPGRAVAAVAGQGLVVGVGVRGLGGVPVGGSRASSQERAHPVSQPSSRPSSSGSNASAVAAAGAGEKDKASQLRERAERLRRDAAAAEAARKVRSDAAVSSAIASVGVVGVGGGAGVQPAGPSSREPSPHPVRPSISVGAGEGERQRVADLDSWEREKGLALPAPRASSGPSARNEAIGAAARVIGAGRGTGVGQQPAGVAALQAAALAQGVQPVPVFASAGPLKQLKSREPSAERPTSQRPGGGAAGMVDPFSVPTGAGGVAMGQGPPGRVSAAPSVASSVSVSVAGSEVGGAGRSVVQGRPVSLSGPGQALGAGMAQARLIPGPARAPTPLSTATSTAPEQTGPDAKARVLALKEARKRAEEDAERLRLESAAREGVADRKRAAFMTKEAYRGLNAAMASALPVSAAVLDASLEEAQDLVKTLSAALPGSRYGSQAQVASDRGYGGTTVRSTDSEDAAGPLDLASASLSVPSGSCPGQGAAPLVGSDGHPLDYVAPPAAEDNVGASTRLGELPSDLDEDSEDEVWLEAGQKPAPAREGESDMSAGPGGAGAALQPPQTRSDRDRDGGKEPEAEAEVEDDIADTETALRVELLRSTLRCAELRQSLVVARRVAVTVGVPMPGPSLHGHSASKTRRSSGVNSVAAASVVATAGLLLPPAVYTSSLATGEGTVAGAHVPSRTGQMSSADERPIRPAATAGSSGGGSTPTGSAPPSGAAAAATARPTGTLPPRGGVLAPSAAATAAAGGYMGGGSSRGPSPTSFNSRSGGLPGGSRPSVPGVDASPVLSSASAPASPPSPPWESAETKEEEDGEEDEEDMDALEDEDDLRDEDGDEEGQVAFAPKPLVGRTPAGKLHSGTIREEDEDDVDDEEDDDDSTFGGEFKTRLGMEDQDQDQGRDTSLSHSESLHTPAGPRPVPMSNPVPVGGLSTRVEDLRRRCMSALGPALYERVYAAVREVAWDGGSEDAVPGSNPDAEEADLAALPARHGLSAAQAPVVQDIALLLQMEQDLM